MKFLLHALSYTFIRSTKFQNFLSCWWSGFCFIYIRFSSCCFFCVPHYLSPEKASYSKRNLHAHSSLLSTSLRVPTTHPQGCVGPFRLVLLYFHLWNNNRRMKCSTFHTPQAAEKLWSIKVNIMFYYTIDVNKSGYTIFCNRILSSLLSSLITKDL